MKMKILLLGDKGQLGQEFVKELKTNAGIEFDSFDLRELDITNKVALVDIAKKKEYDVILNCAAFTNVDLAEEYPELAFNINYFAIRNIVEAAKINRSLLINYSTDYVFSSDNQKWHRVYDCRKPLSKYGESKKHGEDMLRELYDKYLLIRTSWLFGDGPTSFINQLIKWSKSTKKLDLIHDQISSPTYAYDLVKATLNLINSKELGTFHITNTHVSKLEWGKYILNNISWNGQINGVNMSSLNFKANRPLYSILDNEDYVRVCNQKMPSWEDATDRYLHSISR